MPALFLDEYARPVAAAIPAAGMAIAAIIVAVAVAGAAGPDRFVEVKGLAEREFAARQARSRGHDDRI